MSPDQNFLQDGGEMGARMRAFDWQTHPLGPPEGWPQALRTSIRLMLTTQHPVFIFWGQELHCFYNDAYSQSLGPEKHPAMLGARGRDMWPEIWSIIGGQIDFVMAGQGSTWNEDQLVPIIRHGKLDDVYWTYSYSPIDHEGGVGGVLVLCTETTSQVLQSRERDVARARQQRLFEQAPAFIVVMSGSEHVVTFVNNAHRKVFNSDNWVGKPVRDAFPSIAGQGFFELLDKVYTTAETVQFHDTEVRFRLSPDAPIETHFFDFIYAPTFGDDGRVSGIFCEGFDVTATHEAREELRLGEQRFRAAVDAVQGTLWTNDALGRMRGEQPAWAALTGQTFEEYQGYGWSKAVHPDDAQPTIDAWEKAVASRSTFVFEHRVKRAADGEWRRYAVRAIPILDRAGDVVEWVGMHLDVTDRRAAEEFLRDADRRKDEFIATLAHELRNPLAPIRNASQVAKSPHATEAQRRWSHDVIERQVAQMSLLLEDLLDVSRITRGTLQLRREQVELAAIVDTAIETARPLIDSRGHDLTVELPNETVWVEADALRLAQVLSNLLTNAAKYSEPNGQIHLSAERGADDVVIRVRDRGLGIDAEMLPRIFEMFSQGQPAIDRSEGGLGIGLALVRGLVALHGGSVEATSEGVGRGSTFTVRLPLPLAPRRSDALASAQAIDHVRPEARRVLVVDDNRDSAESLALLLGLDGHNIRRAHGGEEALAVAAEFRPEIVLLDIGMPNMNGYEVARRLRAQTWATATTLVAITGWGQAEDKRRASQAGFDHHLVKPVDLRALARLFAPTDSA